MAVDEKSEKIGLRLAMADNFAQTVKQQADIVKIIDEFVRRL